MFFVVGLSRAAHGAHCTFKIALSQAIMFILMFVCAFSPRVQSIPRGSPLIHLKLQGITQASVNSRRTPTSYAYTRIRSCKRIGHQYEYTQSHQRRYAAMFFYAAIVLCASTRQNGIKKHHRLCAMALVGLSRLELPTSRLSGACSNQLSYNPILVEVSGFEPLTPCLQSRCSTN